MSRLTSLVILLEGRPGRKSFMRPEICLPALVTPPQHSPGPWPEKVLGWPMFSDYGVKFLFLKSQDIRKNSKISLREAKWARNGILKLAPVSTFRPANL